MAGILDLVLGLQWVKDNIAAFGGNPDQVTILGESGGAMKICHLLNMPVAKDLFRYAIVESGSGKVGADNREEATDNARKFLANLGITEKELNRLQKIFLLRKSSGQRNLFFTLFVRFPMISI